MHKIKLRQKHEAEHLICIFTDSCFDRYMVGGVKTSDSKYCCRKSFLIIVQQVASSMKQVLSLPVNILAYSLIKSLPIRIIKGAFEQLFYIRVL